MKHILICICLSILFFNTCYAQTTQPKKTVNILTWWGYLDYPKIIAQIEKKCNVNISYDEYYSNTEFLRRRNEGNYDILIFSDTIYPIVKDQIGLTRSDLWKVALDYNKNIKKHYFDAKFPKNVVYFMHSFTGFLWNPKNISLSKNDTITQIFKKAGNKIVIIIDDPFEARNMMNIGLGIKNNFQKDYFTPEEFNKLKQDTKVYIVNSYNKLYKSKDFAFSVIWSGDAINNIALSGEKYKFLIHPKLSYITTDLLSQVNNRKDVTCVSKSLESKPIMQMIQNKDNYFSPYAEEGRINNKDFKKIYDIFLKELPYLPWIKPVDKKDFFNINTNWKIIKMDIHED